MFNRKLFTDWMAAQELVRLYVERNGRGAVIPEHLKKQLATVKAAYWAEVEKQASGARSGAARRFDKNGNSDII